MGQKDKEKSLETQYPSVDLAYEFVKPSYDWMLNRIEAMNSKMQGLLMLATAVTGGIPILAKAIFDNVDFQSVLFYGAIGLYVLLVVIGTVGLSMGGVKLFHPKLLYEKWLSNSIWEFKKDAIYFAGQNFEDNKKIIDAKSWLRNIMTILLLIELMIVIFWISSAT